MKPTIWLRCAEQTWLELATDDKGTLSISRIAARTNLRPETLVLGPETLGAYEGVTIEEVRDICGSTAGQSKELAVLVGGIAKPAAHLEEGEPSSKKPKRSPAEPLSQIEDVAARSTYIRNLLSPPSDLPIRVPDLLAFMSEKSGPLPVAAPDFFELVNDPNLVGLYSPEQFRVAILVSVTCKLFCRRPNNEADSSHKLRTLTGDFLEGLNDLAPADLQLLHLEPTMDSARNPGSASTSSPLVPLKRPNFSLYLRDALILRWENKINSAYFSVALEENIAKLKVWSSLYYGDLPFVIGGCCGGRRFQWLKLSPNGKDIRADPISKEFDLHLVTSVVELLHSVVQMHRLLQKLQGRLTVSVPVRLYKEIQRANGTVLLGPDFVLKTLVPKLAKKKVDFLKSLYESITGSKYLIQLKGKIQSTRQSTKLQLHPVGNPSGRPTCLEHLGYATHDMLHALVVLHEAGYTHRDLRWENCICENVEGQMRWIIIDLETAGRDGDLWKHEKLVNWDSRTLNDNKSYTTGSDMYELGKLIVNWLNGSPNEVSDEGKRIMALGERLMKERGKAAEMLRDMCPPGCARCAIFNT